MWVTIGGADGLVVILFELSLTKALKSAAGGQTIVCDNEVVILYSISFQLASICHLNSLTVDLGEFPSDLGRSASNLVNESEGAEQKDTDDREGDELSEEVVSLSVDTVLPDDVSWLRGLFELHLLAEELLSLWQIQSNDCCVFFLESDEAGCGSGKIFEVLEEFIDHCVLFLNAIEFLQGDVVAAVS